MQCTDDDLCIREFKAFAMGGPCGIERLQHSYKSILEEFNMHTESLDSMLWKAGLQMRNGKITTF